MANTLTNLIPEFLRNLDVVSRELTGFIPGVLRDATADECAQNQTIRIPQTASVSTGSISPAMTVPEGTAQTVGNASVTLSNFKGVNIPWDTEEINAMNKGVGHSALVQSQIQQAFRSLSNEVEAAIADAAQVASSRAYGTAGTTPFASTLGDSAQVRKILDDNGAPPSARSLVINTAAGAALRTLGQLTKANEAGNVMTLRDGELLNLHGFSVRESNEVNSHTAGTGASYQLNGALAVGDTTVTVDTGSGTILAGDVVTIGSHKYVVATALSGGSFTINAPGIRAVVADNTAITVNAAHAANIAFSQDAILLIARPPVGDDGAIERELITDPRTGLTFDMSVYAGFKKRMMSISLLYAVKVLKPAHVATLLG